MAASSSNRPASACARRILKCAWKAHRDSRLARVDRSAGPQTVEKRINPVYWRLIDEFEKHTGVPVRLNTAANLRGEAIVDTPTDANRTRFSFAMDALALRSFLPEK